MNDMLIKPLSIDAIAQALSGVPRSQPAVMQHAALQTGADAARKDIRPLSEEIWSALTSSFRTSVSEARAAVDASDYGRAAKCLHFIKGGFAVVGEVPLTEASHALEILQRNGPDRDAILQRLQDLEQDAERMFAEREPARSI